MKLKPCDDSQHEHKVQQVDQKLDMFWISPRGRECLELDQSYTNPSRFVSFRLHDTPTGKLDGSDLVPFEALLELARRGWTHERRMTSRKVDTYKPNGTKKWFFSKNVCKYYLKVLLSSDRLFEMGLKEIYHFQPATYYKTILFMMKFPEKLNTVKPWQSRSFYILMQQQAIKPTAKRTSAGMTGMVLEEECGGRLLA